MESLIEIKQKVEKIASQIEVNVNLLPHFGISERDGTPHIEVDESNYFYLVYDRNVKSVNKKTQDANELLYWIFSDITFNMGVSYELENRKPDVNHRKVIFSRQLELLEQINSDWKKRRENEIAEILNKNP